MGRSFRIKSDKKNLMPCAKIVLRPSPLSSDKKSFDSALSTNRSPSVETTNCAPSDDNLHQRQLKGCVKTKTPVIYGDISICRVLKIRRRVIAAARTKERRGLDWDCVGLHAGMTYEWIAHKAAELHVAFDIDRLEPILEGDHVASCILMAVVPNNKRAIVDLVATGERRIVWVNDSTTMRLKEIFDCINDHGVLSAHADLNACVY